jgi:hypothetical protein
MGLEPMTSALERSEKVRVLDLAIKRLGGSRTVNIRVGFRNVIFYFSETATLSAYRHWLGCTALRERHLSYFAARGRA